MRIVIVLAVVVALLLFGQQVEANWGVAEHPDLLYNRTSAVCADKLTSWKNVSSDGTAAAGESMPSSDGRNSSSYLDRIFMRGKWEGGFGENSVIRPSFLSGDSGRVDLQSREFGRLLNTAPNGPTLIQNMNGHMYFVGRRDSNKFELTSFFDIGGVFNSRTGEVCLVGCMLPTSWTPRGRTDNGTTSPPEYSDETCGMRIVFTVSQQGKTGRKTASGTFSSLKNESETGYFTDFSLVGKMVNPREQRDLYRWDLFWKALIFAVEAVAVMWQIFHSVRSPSSYFVSMLMIIVQIVVMSCLSIHLLAIPRRLMTMQTFKFLLSADILIPWLALTFVVLLNVVFLLVILRKRRVAKRMNVVERPQEMLLAVVCLVIYAVIGVLLWSAHNFETYVQVVWCWFLLPQVVANVFWDLRLKPLDGVYIVGVSLCRIAYIGFNASRPKIYGLDDIEDFPHGWFWGITGTVVIFASYALLQQYYGGRCYLPQRFFGYQYLASSKAQANQEDDDTMLDL